MTPTFLFPTLLRGISASTGFVFENAGLRSPRSGCRRPKWWFSATVLAVRLCSTSFGQQRGRPQQGRGQVPPRPDSVKGAQQVRPTFEGDLKSASNKELYLVLDSGNTLKFRVNGKTVFYDGDQKIKV